MATKNKVKRFAPKLHVRRGDQVMVISGDDKGKTGLVLQVFTDKNRAIVEGINIVKKHVKASQTEEGGIREMEATMKTRACVMHAQEETIHISNLAHVDPKTGEATRIGYRVEENGEKVRFSKKSGNIIK